MSAICTYGGYPSTDILYKLGHIVLLKAYLNYILLKEHINLPRNPVNLTDRDAAIHCGKLHINGVYATTVNSIKYVDKKPTNGAAKASEGRTKGHKAAKIHDAYI